MRAPLGAQGIRPQSSHSRLMQDATESSSTGRGRPSSVDAIVVPASRPASFVGGLIDLSVRLGTLLVVLCSMQTKVEQVAERVAKAPGARALLIDVTTYRLPHVPRRTSAPAFVEASNGRSSDLSTKRNLGLLLARLSGWTKIFFLDDDITLGHAESYRRLARQLEQSQIAGMVCRDYPDNSVLCHARRLAKQDQDNFVSGSALGVQCNDLPLPFFPDIYNEDWFFFSREAAKLSLPNVGDVTQAPYSPFADPGRARHEEFGDLLAEGLYSLIGEINDPELPYHRLLSCATSSFWAEFMEARWEDLLETRRWLEKFGAYDGGRCEISQALLSLDAAEEQLFSLTPGVCVDFLEAWQDDISEWERFSTGLNEVGGVREAMDNLDIRHWRLAQFGDAYVSGSEPIVVAPEMPKLPTASRLRGAASARTGHRAGADARR